MENCKKFAPLALLLALVVKGIVSGINLPAALVCISLTALIFGMEHFADKKALNAIKDAHSVDIKELKDQLASQQKEVGEIRSYVTSVKMGTQFRSR